MVIKTDVCVYTEMKIYPGHGSQFVRKDGKLVSFLSAKAKSLFMQRISAQKLTWTMAWRRKNKKGKTDNVTQKRRKKTVRVFKSIQGITIDDIRKRRTQTKEYRKAASENYKREIKDRVTKKSKGKATYAKKAVFAKTPKYRSTRVNMGKK